MNSVKRVVLILRIMSTDISVLFYPIFAQSWPEQAANNLQLQPNFKGSLEVIQITPKDF